MFSCYRSLSSPAFNLLNNEFGNNIDISILLAFTLKISITHSYTIMPRISPTGFAFVFFEDERDADDAIHDLHDRPFGSSKRRLTVEWSKQGDRGGPRHRDGSKSLANTKPSKTLFVINFDPFHTRTRDIEKHFEPYGKVSNIRIRKNFAFVQFETQEEATKALECTNMSKILDRVVTVEYALRDDGEPDDNYGRGGYGGRRWDSPRRERSLSPVYRRSRPSPDYGRAHSPVYDPYNVPTSYDRERVRDRSPIHDRYNGPTSYDRERVRDRSPAYGRYSSRSPVRRYRA